MSKQKERICIYSTDISKQIGFNHLAINVIFPIDMGEAKFCHIQVPIDKEGFDYQDYLQTYWLYADAKIPLGKDEFLDMKLKILRKGVTKYTMQYRNPSLGITIRADDAHGFPHIDIEDKGKPQRKIRLKTAPNDYEESINTILRYVEKNVDSLIGPKYWLRPYILNTTGTYILKLFDLFQYAYDLNSSFTDLARLINLEIIDKTLSGNIIDLQEFQDIINNQFALCLEEEIKNDSKPFLASNNKNRQGFHLLPFPLIIPAGVSFKVNYIKDDYSSTNIENITLAGFVIGTH